MEHWHGSFSNHVLIILLFLFKSEKRKRSHIGKISNYLWEKENCLNELERLDDSEIINFSNLAVRFNLRNVSGLIHLICNIDELKNNNLNLLFKYMFFM